MMIIEIEIIEMLCPRFPQLIGKFSGTFFLRIKYKTVYLFVLI